MAEAKSNKPAPARDPVEEGEDVTYQPGHGDPPFVTWRGVTFHANVPVRLTDTHHLSAAHDNRFFRVGDGGESADDNPNRDPATPAEYRRHFVKKINKATTCLELVKAFASERRLREDAGVGHDDIDYLGHLVEPKLNQMRLSEGRSDRELMDMWLKHGVIDIPWRG